MNKLLQIELFLEQNDYDALDSHINLFNHLVDTFVEGCCEFASRSLITLKTH